MGDGRPTCNRVLTSGSVGMGIPMGDSCGHGMGMGIEMPSPRQPWCGVTVACINSLGYALDAGLAGLCCNTDVLAYVLCKCERPPTLKFPSLLPTVVRILAYTLPPRCGRPLWMTPRPTAQLLQAKAWSRSPSSHEAASPKKDFGTIGATLR